MLRPQRAPAPNPPLARVRSVARPFARARPPKSRPDTEIDYFPQRVGQTCGGEKAGRSVRYISQITNWIEIAELQVSPF